MRARLVAANAPTAPSATVATAPASSHGPAMRAEPPASGPNTRPYTRTIA